MRIKRAVVLIGGLVWFSVSGCGGANGNDDSTAKGGGSSLAGQKPTASGGSGATGGAGMGDTRPGTSGRTNQGGTATNGGRSGGGTGVNGGTSASGGTVNEGGTSANGGAHGGTTGNECGGSSAGGAAPNGSPPWSIRMSDTVLSRHPNAVRLNADPASTWGYTQGFAFTALDLVYRKTQDKKYWDYIVSYYEGMIDNQGKIGGYYNMGEYNLDSIAPGKALKIVFDETKKAKFQTALDTLRQQLRDQPRNSLGGFWHKKRYPNQMWLDSLYMGAAFLARYGLETEDNAGVDQAILQFTLLEEHARDPKTGLLYHAWDESRAEQWANPQTGTSPAFWGRAMGWYAMALVDTLEVLPESHPKRPDLLAILTRLLTAISAVVDPQSGVWYQVMDQGSRQGNYLESSASSMFAYVLLKASRLGYVDKTYRDLGRRAFEGVVKTFIRVEGSGDLTLTNGCLVAGLGPDPQVPGRYRDGSFDYYVNEKKGDNPTQGIPAFILAALEYESDPCAPN